MIHIKILLVIILLLDIEMLTIVSNFNIYEDICHAQNTFHHNPRLRGPVSSSKQKGQVALNRPHEL